MSRSKRRQTYLVPLCVECRTNPAGQYGAMCDACLFRVPWTPHPFLILAVFVVVGLLTFVLVRACGVG